MVKAIFAYKNLNRFWKPKDEYFWKLARLSVRAASKFYTTVLYSDSETKDLLREKGIKFDEYQSASETFNLVTEHTYGLAKVCAMIDQTSPYITLDLDTVLLSKPYSSAHIMYGHKEIDMSVNKPIPDMKTDLEYLERYYGDSFDILEQDNILVQYFGIKSFDWRTYPSNSFMLVNSPELIKGVYEEILLKLGHDLKIVPPKYTVQFYEQFLFYNLLRKHNADIEFIYNKPPGTTNLDNITLNDILSFKYLHLDKYDRDSNVKKIIDLLENTL